MPLIILLALIVDHEVVIHTPMPLASVMRSATHRLVVGAWKPPTRAGAIDRRTVIKDHIDLPPTFGSEVRWTVHDLNGREIDRGHTSIPETGERTYRWTPDDGRRTSDDARRTLVVAVTLHDEHGQYLRGLIVVVPN